MNELKDELLMFPRGKHDDLLDGLYYATNHNYPPYNKKINTENHHSTTNFAKKTTDWMVS